MTGTAAPVDTLPAPNSPVANTLAAAAGGTMADSYLSLRAGTQARGLHGQLVQQLGRMIVAGELGADRPLVPEEIGRRFEVSRTVVRESLRVLEAKGMVTARPNVGTRIRPVPEWNLLDPDVIEWRAAGVAGLDQCRELAELRCAFEPLAAQLASGRLSESAAARLSELAVLLKQAAANGDQPGYAKIDGEFHALLVAECPNRMVEHLARVVTGAAESAGHAAPFLRADGRRRRGRAPAAGRGDRGRRRCGRRERDARHAGRSAGGAVCGLRSAGPARTVNNR